MLEEIRKDLEGGSCGYRGGLVVTAHGLLPITQLNAQPSRTSQNQGEDEEKGVGSGGMTCCALYSCASACSNERSYDAVETLPIARLRWHSCPGSWSKLMVNVGTVENETRRACF